MEENISSSKKIDWSWNGENRIVQAIEDALFGALRSFSYISIFFMLCLISY